MKTEKKLTRGLKDLSPLFSPVVKPAKKVFHIEKPTPTSWNDTRLAQLTCTSFLPVHDLADSGYEMELLRALSKSYQRTYYLSIEPTYERYEMLSELFPIPPREHMVVDDAIHFHPLSGLIQFAHVPNLKFKEMTVLKPSLAPLEFDETKKTLIAFDSAHTCEANKEIINLLDYGILITTASADHLMESYETIRAYTRQNPAIRFCVLFLGYDAEAMGQFIYDGFCEIVSQFAGCDLGFLGWNEQKKTVVNSEILLQGVGSIAQNSAKIRLSEMLRLAEC